MTNTVKSDYQKYSLEYDAYQFDNKCLLHFNRDKIEFQSPKNRKIYRFLTNFIFTDLSQIHIRFSDGKLFIQDSSPLVIIFPKDYYCLRSKSDQFVEEQKDTFKSIHADYAFPKIKEGLTLVDESNPLVLYPSIDSNYQYIYNLKGNRKILLQHNIKYLKVLTAYRLNLGEKGAVISIEDYQKIKDYLVD